MRPRHKAAENVEDTMREAIATVASMRPRHKAAENTLAGMRTLAGYHLASMRPRHKAAENIIYRDDTIAHIQSFNEAAA